MEKLVIGDDVLNTLCETQVTEPPKFNMESPMENANKNKVSLNTTGNMGDIYRTTTSFLNEFFIPMLESITTTQNAIIRNNAYSFMLQQQISGYTSQPQQQPEIYLPPTEYGYAAPPQPSYQQPTVPISYSQQPLQPPYFGF